MSIALSDIVMPDRIELGSVNGLNSFHPLCLLLIYLLIIVITVVAVVVMKKRFGFGVALRRGVVAALLGSGIVHAGLSELLWTQWFLADMKLFGRLTVQNKPGAIDGEFYRFVQECKKQVGSNNYALYPDTRKNNAAMNYFARKLEYYLLPARNDQNAAYIIVMADSSVNFDEGSGIFQADGKRVEPVALVNSFSPGTYILRRKP